MPAVSTPSPSNADISIDLMVDGAVLKAERGMTIAAAMETAGRHSFSRGLKGEPRGLFCGMGACQDCLVTVNGKTSQRACMTSVQPGMTISLPQPRPDIMSTDYEDLAAVPSADIPVFEADLLVVGAGPAGLSAAQAAASAGASVILLDERSAAGGQYFKQPLTQTAARLLADDEQARSGARLVQAAQAAGVTFFEGTTVWGAARGQDLSTTIAGYGANGAFYCKPRMTVIAAGAHERPQAIKGWTLPGVMTAGSAQTLLRSYATLAGRRVVVAGNGPLNIQVAGELLKAGATIVALVEKAPAPWTRPAAALQLFAADPLLAAKGMRQLENLPKAGIPILWESEVISAAGEGVVEEVAVSGPNGQITFPADTLLVGGNFAPSNELSRLLGCAHDVLDGNLVAVCKDDGETSLPDVHVVGEAARFGGAHVAMAAGRLAGIAIARKLGLAEASVSGIGKRLARHRAFQKELWAVFAVRVPGTTETIPDATILCRCEGVTYGALRQLAEASALDVATMKRLSRAGMGRCQSRYCGAAIAGIAKSAHKHDQTRGFLAPQMPLRPVPVAALAVEKPEWGGHKRAVLPNLPPLKNAEPLPLRETSTLVIGGGIAGISTALFLAREGEDVTVLERSFPNSLASGGNAGSLHAQLLSFDHGARSEGGGGPAAQTLPLQRDSISLWASLQRELGRDFEMKVTGGLMVAETGEHIRFLKEKIAVEQKAGIECRLLDQDELRDMEPALSRQFVGAAYCPQEGKINPLVATEHMLKAARENGARIIDNCEVIAIAPEKGGFEVVTNRGRLRAGRIVNAAGAFSSRIGAMLGLDIPVFGAPLQMVVTEAAAPTISCLVAHADRHLTLKQAANGNFIIGGGWTAGLDPVFQHPRPLLSSIEGNLWVAQYVVPALRKLHVIRSWAAMNINIDGAPVLGEHPDQPGFFNAVTSNGYTLGPIVGQLTAQLVLGRETGRALQPFSISRFKKGRS